MSLKKIDKLLNSKGGNALEELVQHAQDMDDLALRVRLSLDPAARDSIAAANLRDDGELVVVCKSSAWAARLRFESERMMRAAKDGGYEVTRCRVRVGR